MGLKLLLVVLLLLVVMVSAGTWFTRLFWNHCGKIAAIGVLMLYMAMGSPGL